MVFRTVYVYEYGEKNRIDNLMTMQSNGSDSRWMAGKTRASNPPEKSSEKYLWFIKMEIELVKCFSHVYRVYVYVTVDGEKIKKFRVLISCRKYRIMNA